MKQIFPGIWKKGNSLFTQNLIPGDRSFTERIIRFHGKEYREWSPWRSKPAAAILKGLKIFPLKREIKILYLGIANGTTASFFSDIIGKEGLIYGIEISERAIRDLTSVAEKRGNIVPVLGNAKLPEEYSWIEPVDLVYEDVATDDQSDILIRNSEKFLKPQGFAMMAIKARSIDVTKSPKEIYKEEIKKLEKRFEILEKIELDPYEKDHLFVVMRLK